MNLQTSCGSVAQVVVKTTDFDNYSLAMHAAAGRVEDYFLQNIILINLLLNLVQKK